MLRQLSFLGGATALATVLFLPATIAAWERGVAILPPIESPDKGPHHPPGTFVPYYGSPLTPISKRWRPIAYVPYYRGYCRPCKHYAHAPYGIDGVGLPEPGCETAGLVGAPGYGPYTGAPRDEARLLRLGGNAPYVPSQLGAVDIIDAMQGSHGPNGACPP